MAWFKEAQGIVRDKLQMFWRQERVRHWFLAVFVYLTLVGILLANLIPERTDLRVGEVAKRDITAPKTIVNQYRTDQLKAEAADQAAQKAAEDEANYTIDENVVISAKEKLGAAFDAIEGARAGRSAAQTQNGGSEPSASSDSELSFSEADIEQVQTLIETEATLTMDKQTIVTLLRLPVGQFQAVENASVAIAENLLGSERISQGRVAEILQSIPERVSDYLVRADLDTVLPKASRDAIVASVMEVVQPNLKLDDKKIADIRTQAMAQIEPVMVLQGEIVVRRGDVITREKVQILKDLGLQRARTSYLTILGISGAVLLTVAFLVVYLWQNQRELLHNDSLLALLGLLVIVYVFVVKILSLIPWEGIGYLMPTAFAAMMVSLLLDSHMAYTVVVMLSFIVGLVTGFELIPVVTSLAGGFAAAFSVGRVTQRSDVTRAGFISGIVSFMAMAIMGLSTSNMFVLKNSYLGLINGVISAILTIGFLPYLESLFGITSSIKLLELSNPNQPLLRKLLLEAPGTYHHSVIVSNLAEAAVEAVGGDGLLARVGAMYHDIGKTKRPYFFVENQITTENPHDKLSPSLSTLIITSHVKDGVELAKQYKLPLSLVDFITQHHGDDLVRFFYHKAVESGQSVEEEDFRYPGPKPQSKETAIVMLADSVEAAVRSLSRPTPGRIEGLVRKIIKSRLSEGQLDESNLTLKDLDKIAHAFVQVLGGIFHTRIEYPPENVLREELTKNN